MKRMAWVLAAMLGPALAGAAAAQSIEEFYRGKQIRFIIASDAGGDYDQWARLIARHWGKHLPGKPTFVPVNMPGGGMLTATNYLFNVAEKDGLVVGMIGRNLPNQALLKHASVRFDPLKFNWLGSPELTNRVCVAKEGAPVQKAEDLYDRELIVGGSGAGTAVSTTPVILNRLLGMKFKLVDGYPSGQAVLLAMERGEVQGICQSYTSLRGSKPEWFSAGKVKVLFNLERTPLPDVKVPTVYEFIKDDEARRLLSLYNSSVEIGRPILAPPGVPADRVDALRRAFDATMRDSELKAEASKLGLEINALTGEQLSEIIAELMNTPKEIVDKMQALVQAKN
jgi:tripartite-type tricarboxylate transporter receptor subunit TctC